MAQVSDTTGGARGTDVGSNNICNEPELLVSLIKSRITSEDAVRSLQYILPYLLKA